jgi:catechol 2,3-dioxygenase-like lactoylglutathione lyase family enzyme
MQAEILRIRPARWWARVAIAAAAAIAFTMSASAAQTVAVPASAPPLVEGVDSIVITVSDIDRAVDFYTNVLPFRRVADREAAGENYEHLFGLFGLRVRMVRLALGDEYIELAEFLAPRGRPHPADSRSNDRWFQHVALIVRDMDEAYAHLRRHKVEHASSGPQRLPDWNSAAGGIEAFYFRDPDGNPLEILHFPPGKGATKWQDRSRMFLGIDHTAIVVADTDASLAYYRDMLGLRIAGTSENHGIEQERLNNVFGARLRITALRAASGPGVELLEYLAPGTGRPMPGDTLPNDLWYWQINMRTRDAQAAATAVGRRARLLSSGVALTPRREFGPAAGLILRDPDGHAALLFSSP